MTFRLHVQRMKRPFVITRRANRRHSLTSIHPRRALIWLYANTGQGDRALELFGEYVRGGAPMLAAVYHVLYGMGDLLGDDPRYQALLEEAGITW